MTNVFDSHSSVELVDIRSCVHRQGMVVILRSSKRESGFIIGFRIARSHYQIMIYIQLGRGYSLLFFKIFYVMYFNLTGCFLLELFWAKGRSFFKI